ncbi:MAG TPA: hypothetical protein VLK25_00950 [Allosphingosinicella sp.]|nr:hypothetical protein [Allosphingosinicella sp.]
MLALFPSLLLVAAQQPVAPPDPRVDPSGPSYDAEAVYRLEFHGIRLGMARDEVCRRLTANGYTLESPGRCGPLAPRDYEDEPPGDSYRGTAPGGSCRASPCDPASPSSSVQFISVEYERADGRDLVRSFYLWTSEPSGRDALTEATVRAWGRPTYYARWGYNVLLYGASADQAEYYNREKYGRCVYNPGCAAIDGLDCGAILNDYATPHAQVTAYDGFRVIQVEDARLELRDLRASGVIDGRRVAVQYLCPVASVH